MMDVTLGGRPPWCAQRTRIRHGIMSVMCNALRAHVMTGNSVILPVAYCLKFNGYKSTFPVDHQMVTRHEHDDAFVYRRKCF